jgi:hypothetical protein
MGFGLKKRNEVAGDIPVYQLVHEVSQGGYTLDITGLVAGSVVPAGTVFIADDATRKAKPIKTATIVAVAAADALVYQVAKGSQFATGDNVALVVKGKAYPATIDKSNTLYDTLTVPTSLGTAAVGATIFQSSTTGATNSALLGVPTGTLLENAKVEPNTSITLALRATIYARRIPGVPADVKALLPLIIFSQSK